MKFLETLLNENLDLTLIRIDEIYNVSAGNLDGQRKIVIGMNDGHIFEEKFDTPEGLEARYEHIKKVIEGA